MCMPRDRSTTEPGRTFPLGQADSQDRMDLIIILQEKR